jgi:ribulose-phosphate 3-epimerase
VSVASSLGLSPRVQIAPSLLAADFGHLADAVRAVEASGAEVVHLDVMDGVFVPNISYGAPVIKAVRPLTTLPFMAHLMIEAPERYVETFRELGCDEILVHEEASPHLHRTLQMIRHSGARAGVALNVHTPLNVLEWVKDLLDSVLVMTVNPGFGGQAFIAEMLPKIEAARRMLGPDVDIVVDGGIDASTAPRVVAAGANVLVAGTSVFAHPDGVSAGVAALRSGG